MQEKEERVKAKEREGKKKAERTLGQQHNYVQQKQRIPLEAPLCLFQDRLKPWEVEGGKGGTTVVTQWTAGPLFAAVHLKSTYFY